MFQIVPDEFIGRNDQRCSNLTQLVDQQQNRYALGCHCLEKNEKCREILLFLKQSQRFRALAVANVLYHDIRLASDSSSVVSFNAMLDDIVYPAFIRKFKRRHVVMLDGCQHFSINSLQDCFDNGPDSVVAFNTMNNLLQKVFRVYFVMNKDINPPSDSSLVGRKRHHGTLIANLNFLLEEGELNDKMPTIAFSKLQDDLIGMGKWIAPTKMLAIHEVMQLLGYTQSLGLNPDAENTGKFEIEFFRKDICKIEQLHKSWQHYLNVVSEQFRGTKVL